MSESVAMEGAPSRAAEVSASPPASASQRDASTGDDSNAGPTKQGEAPSVSWQDVKSVQNLIERCLQKFMTQTEIIAALQVEANVDPSFTCLVWQKLEQQNPEFFFSYHTRLKMRDQIVAFNYLVDQQVYLIRMASGGMMPPPGMPPPGMPPPGMPPPGMPPPGMPPPGLQPGIMPHHPLAQHPGFPQGMPIAGPPPQPPGIQGAPSASQAPVGLGENPLPLPQGQPSQMTPNVPITGPPPQRPHEAFPLMPQGLTIGPYQLPGTAPITASSPAPATSAISAPTAVGVVAAGFAPMSTAASVLPAHGKVMHYQNHPASEALPLEVAVMQGEGQDKEAGRKPGSEAMDVDVGGGDYGGEYIDVFRS